MNCKPGDLAIVVRVPSDRVAHHLGMIVRLGRVIRTDTFGVACWALERPIRDDRFSFGAVLEAIADRDLRPIRGQEGDDETLTWAGKPEKVTA